MVTSQIDIKAKTIELATEAFETFCEDISGMFGVEMECQPQEPCPETTKTLNKRFKKITAVNCIKSEGALNGSFQIAFDKEGLFTLAGTIVMLPEQRILQNRKTGTAQDAEDMSDAIGEAGNMLVGSWDRVFREELEGHGHFVQTQSFIGDPWSNSERDIGLPSDQELLFIPYEITIDPYPTFKCGVILQENLFRNTSSDAEPAVSADQTPQEEATEPENPVENTTKPQDDAPAPTTDDTLTQEPTIQEDVPEEQEPEASTDTTDSAEKTDANKPIEPEIKESPEPAKQPEASTTPTEPIAEETEQPAGNTESAKGAVSESIEKIVQSSANLPGEYPEIYSKLCAEDIMQKEVLWADPEDTVQQAMAKMQQADAGCILVGKESTLEGIVSESEISGAVSVYLKPMFAKWRRPVDDATLQIRVKWIMTRPVQIVKQDASLNTIMNTMSQSGTRYLPVTDQQGKVTGLVTVFDIFKTLLNTDPNVSTAGKTTQAPPLE